MTPAEAAALLTVAAAFDNRKPDPDQARAWATALDGLRFEDCREAIVNHYRTSLEWMMPAHVFGGVKRIQDDRERAFGAKPDPPPELNPNDTAAWQRWLSDTNRRIRDGELTTDDPKPLPSPRGDAPTPLEAAAKRQATKARVDEIRSQLARRPPKPDHPTFAKLAERAAATDEARTTRTEEQEEQEQEEQEQEETP